MAKVYIYPKILEEMKKHKESQVELGKVLGITDLSLRHKLAGTRQWTISEIDKLCMHYNKDYYELFK